MNRLQEVHTSTGLVPLRFGSGRLVAVPYRWWYASAFRLVPFRSVRGV
ncbi:hypothetical protein [Caudoviricetes sp.]|nr:hypothetical protein [Caudoviricetes sp.]